METVMIKRASFHLAALIRSAETVWTRDNDPWWIYGHDTHEYGVAEHSYTELAGRALVQGAENVPPEPRAQHLSSERRQGGRQARRRLEHPYQNLEWWALVRRQEE